MSYALVGKRVQIKAQPPSAMFPNGLVEEYGLVIDWTPATKMYTVSVDMTLGEGDDGLRVVPEDHVELTNVEKFTPKNKM